MKESGRQGTTGNGFDRPRAGKESRLQPDILPQPNHSLPKIAFCMFPLRDDIPSRRIPIVNYTMIGICVLIFLVQNSVEDQLVGSFGMTPVIVSHPDEQVVVLEQRPVQTRSGIQVVEVERQLPTPAVSPLLTLLTCTFLHGSLMHLIGNVWFLYVFGDNVEDRLGKTGYLIFYLGSGIAASLTHYAFQPESTIPTIGASGAVAGVMGAYMWLYPHAKVTTLIPILFILQLIVLPAPWFLGFWFVIQLVQGTFSMGNATAAGVAWWAHAGGFAFGFAVAWITGRDSDRHQSTVIVRMPRR